MTYVSPFRRRRLARLAASGSSASDCELQIPVPFTMQEEYSLAARLLRARTAGDLEVAFEAVMMKAADKTRTSSRRKRRTKRETKATPPTVRTRLRKLLKRIQPALRAGAGVAGATAIKYGVEHLLDYLGKVLGQEVAFASNGIPPLEKALELTRLVGALAQEISLLPEPVPPQVAVEIALRRARGARRSGRASSTPRRIPPRTRARSAFRYRSPWPLGSGLASSVTSVGVGTAPTIPDAGDWARPAGDLVLLFNCTHDARSPHRGASTSRF